MKKVLHNKKKKHLVQDREQLLLNNASLEMRSTNANGRKLVRLSKSETHLNLTGKGIPMTTEATSWSKIALFY